MDVGKADTLKHGHRPEKLFMDMYMTPTYKEVNKNAVRLLSTLNPIRLLVDTSLKYSAPCFIRKLTDDWLNSVQAQIKKSSYVKYNNIQIKLFTLLCLAWMLARPIFNPSFYGIQNGFYVIGLLLINAYFNIENNNSKMVQVQDNLGASN